MKHWRLISIDVMGTLVKLATPVGVSYSQAAAKHGINISPELLTKNFSRVWREMKVAHPIYGRHTGIGWEEWWKMLVHKTFSYSTSDSLDKKLLCEISEKLIYSYNHRDKWKCSDGAIEFLNHCHNKKIPLAVLSNFDRRLEGLLETMGVRKYFRFVVASYTVGVEKPDEKIFKLTEDIAKSFKDLQDIKRNEILHIGDLPEYDYIPAKNAGWCAYLITKKSEDILQKYPEDRVAIQKATETVKEYLHRGKLKSPIGCIEYVE